MPDDVTSPATDLHWLTIADAARLIEQRRLSPVELTDALIARAEALDPQLNAFLLPTPERAREQARVAEREIMAGGYRGPLHGIPFGLKDIYATAGIRTTSHSKICETLVPTWGTGAISTPFRECAFAKFPTTKKGANIHERQVVSKATFQVSPSSRCPGSCSGPPSR